MALLVIGGVTIPVAWPDGVREEAPLEVGDRMETFDGGERSGVSGRKRRWRIRTRSLDAATYAAVTAAVTAAPPLAVVLDAEAIDCSASLQGAGFGKGAGVLRRALEFELRER